MSSRIDSSPEIVIPQVLRGMVGGIAGNLIKYLLALFVWSVIPHLRMGYFGNVVTASMLAVLGIPSAAIAGAIVTLAIRATGEAMKRSFGPVARAIIGGGLLVSFSLMVLAYDKLYPVDNRWSLNGLSSWMIVAVFFIDFGLSIGVVAGLMTGRLKSTC